MLYVLHKSMRRITCIQINEIFYVMHVLTIITTCTFFVELEVQENKFGSYTRIGVMENAQGYYSHVEDIIGLHINIGNVGTNSNGRRDRHEPITMRNLHREVQSYREDNERIMKAHEEILWSLNMLHNKVIKDSSTKQANSSRKVTKSRSHNRKDDHGNDRKSRSKSRHHHSPRQSTIRTHASSGPESNPIVYPIRRQRRRLEEDIFQGELRKIKTPNFNGEHRKGEKAEAWLLEMNTYF
jgi:hypothetical protein